RPAVRVLPGLARAGPGHRRPVHEGGPRARGQAGGRAPDGAPGGTPVSAGLPVMGHPGLTPQSVNTLGGYRVQGRSDEQAAELLADAKELERAGAFAVVLECVPNAVAERITGELNIPTVGIGAGPGTDAQVLVWQDMAG